MPKITSYWQHETGVWDKEKEKFVEKKKSPISVKEINVVLDTSNYSDKPILKFQGGPTGFESYYLDDFLQDYLDKIDRFYICAGTLNSWPSCYVLASDLKQVIKELLKNG